MVRAYGSRQAKLTNKAWFGKSRAVGSANIETTEFIPLTRKEESKNESRRLGT